MAKRYDFNSSALFNVNLVVSSKFLASSAGAEHGTNRRTFFTGCMGCFGGFCERSSVYLFLEFSLFSIEFALFSWLYRSFCVLAADNNLTNFCGTSFEGTLSLQWRLKILRIGTNCTDID